jgi:GTPase involved in cell partitioning and DNA repair
VVQGSQREYRKGLLDHIMLIGNKTDLNDQQTVTIFVRDGRSFARKNGLAFMEISAFKSTGVDRDFQRIFQEIYKTQMKKQIKSANAKGEELEHGMGGQFQAGHGQAITLSYR